MLVDISDAFSRKEHAPGLPSRAVAKLLRMIDPDGAQKRDCRRRPRPIAAQAEIAGLFESGATSVLDACVPAAAADNGSEVEAAAIRSGIGRILGAMYANRNADDSKLARRLSQVAKQITYA
jgi:hypothetical protein